MTTYFAAPDGIDEPTLWAETDDPRKPVAILRHRDLGPMAHHWDELVARVIAGNPDALAEQWALDQSLARGLADSAAGRVTDLGDFTQYADNPDAANRWTLQQLKQRQDIRGDHLERGHTWTIIGGDPTAHCPCGATMNVPVEGWKG